MGGGAGGRKLQEHPTQHPKKDSRHQYALTRLVTPMGSADDGKRNEMEMDVVFRAGGPMGGGLGEGGHEVAPGHG